MQAATLPATVAIAWVDGDPTHDLFPEERAALGPTARQPRVTRFTRGRQAARVALQDLGVPGQPIGVGADREPNWPSGVVGAISHVAHLSVAAVSWESDHSGLGIDIERLQPATEIRGLITTPEENRWLATLSEDERNRNLIAIFSAKETIYKAFRQRVGRWFGFEDAYVEPTTNGYRARLKDGLDVAYPSDRVFVVEARMDDELVLTWLALDPD